MNENKFSTLATKIAAAETASLRLREAWAAEYHDIAGKVQKKIERTPDFAVYTKCFTKGDAIVINIWGGRELTIKAIGSRIELNSKKAISMKSNDKFYEDRSSGQYRFLTETFNIITSNIVELIYKETLSSFKSVHQ